MTADAVHGSVWRERGFAAFWAGQGLSQLGAQFAALALPIIAVTHLHATEAQMGYLGAAETAAFLVVGLPAGAWLDRMRKRRVMLAADLVRAVAILAIPLLHIAGALQMWHLFVVGAVIGVATVFFDVGYQSFVPVLVRDAFVGSANGVLESTAQIMRLGGPALAGILLKVVSAPLLLVVNAVGFVLSALALSIVRDTEVVRPKTERRPLVTEIREGLSFVAHSDFLRRIVATTALSNLGSTLVFTLEPILILRILDLDETFYGVLMTVGAVGGLLGSMLAVRVSARIGEGQTLVAAAAIFATFSVLVPLAALVPTGLAIALLLASHAISMFAVLVYNIVQVTARQRMCPKPLLGRMNASIRFVVWGVMPLGALAAGWLGALLGTVATIWVGVAVGAASVLPLMLSPYRSMRALPTRSDAPGANGATPSAA